MKEIIKYLIRYKIPFTVRNRNSLFPRFRTVWKVKWITLETKLLL